MHVYTQACMHVLLYEALYTLSCQMRTKRLYKQMCGFVYIYPYLKYVSIYVYVYSHTHT